MSLQMTDKGVAKVGDEDAGDAGDAGDTGDGGPPAESELQGQLFMHQLAQAGGAQGSQGP